MVGDRRLFRKLGCVLLAIVLLSCWNNVVVVVAVVGRGDWDNLERFYHRVPYRNECIILAWTCFVLDIWDNCTFDSCLLMMMMPQ